MPCVQLPGVDADTGSADNARMDALSELLKVVRLRRASFFYVDFSAPWCVHTPGAAGLDTTQLNARDEQLVIFHLLTQGEAKITVGGLPPVHLLAGDVVVCPHGAAHEIASVTGGAMRLDVDLAALLKKPRGKIAFGGGGDDGVAAQFICGYLACDARLCRPVFAALPEVVLVSLRGDPGMDWLETSIRHAAAQALSPRPGGEGVLTRLSEVLFIETVRRHMEALAPEQTGWLAGLRDAVVGNALANMHQRPAQGWTVESLAREAGVSRSVMAERFSHFVGQSPMSYLGKLRMALAADLLRDGSQSLMRVAEQVGYETDAAFSRAFRREFGLPPAAWRKAQTGAAAVAGGPA